MRNELIDLYKLACANPQDKDIVRAYQSAKDRIGPQIAIHEALDNDALRSRVARLEEAGRNILCKIPETKNDYSGVGYCFGCGVVKWASGQGSYSEECKPDCALQEFRRALEEK